MLSASSPFYTTSILVFNLCTYPLPQSFLLAWARDQNDSHAKVQSNFSKAFSNGNNMHPYLPRKSFPSYFTTQLELSCSLGILPYSTRINAAAVNIFG